MKSQTRKSRRKEKRQARPGRRPAAREPSSFSEREELQALHRVLTLVARGGSGLTFRRIGEVLRTSTGFEVVTVERYLPQEKAMELLGAVGIARGSARRSAVVPLAETLSGRVLRMSKPLLVYDALRRPTLMHPLLRKLRIRTFVSFPLRIRGSAIGALSIATKRQCKVDPRLLKFLDAVVVEVAHLMDAWLTRNTLESSEDRYRQFFTGALDAIIVTDPISSRIVDANRQAGAMTGYARSDLLGKNIFELYPAHEHYLHRKALAALRKGGKVRNLRVVHFLRRDGSTIPTEVNARSVNLGGKRVIVGTARDITGRQNAEARLSASEELLRIIVEGTLGMFFYVHDRRGIFTYVSPSVEKITGHSVKDWRARYDKFMTPNPINDLVREYTERSLKEGTTSPVYQCEIYHADGHILLLEINEKPIFKDGNVVGIQGVAQDITEKKKLEETILESREYLNRILSQSPMAIAVFDADGMLIDLNAAGISLVGLEKKDDLVGKVNIRTSPYIQRIGLQQKVADVFQGETLDLGSISVIPALLDPSVSLSTKEITVQAKMFPVSDRSGRVVNVVAMMEDVSERKHLEEQLRQSQKMESIGLLAGGIAHDFNNILGGILGYASYLKSSLPAHDKAFSHLETIELSALRAAELTGQLLAFARGGKYDVKPLNVNSVIEETMKLLGGTLDKTIRIEVDLEEGIDAVEADASQIQQVLMNLCVNARDAMPGGGILKITSRQLAKPDRFLMNQGGIRSVPYLRLTVSDSGMGIDKTIMGRVFEPFFTTKEKGKGTGLGLATVYGIVKNHQGFIRLESDVGRGTAFTIYLPTVDTPAVTSEMRHHAVIGGDETILVVDDEQVIRSLVRDVLQAKGYKVVEAVNGLQALEIYGAHMNGIDLVVLDMAMPVLGGAETFRALKVINKDVKVILSTGYSADDTTRELMAMGANAFVQKPYKVDQLAVTVRAVLESETMVGASSDRQR